jgi:NADH-quinone oxidoreductase subunit G
MVNIRINGTDYQVKPGKNLLQTCLSLGFDIPHFCFHPALGSVGACRQCAVKKFAGVDDKRGKIVMSCMEPVAEGLIISTDDPEVKAFRAAVIEGLMTNHPHDCPVCDEGGECHLQDMTVMTGHNYRRFVFKKRTHNNQFLGPYINHVMNRCIQCYRCVRFYRDYAGGKDFNVFGSANRVYFGRFRDGNLESEFSGNLIEVCPTGVFTDKTLEKHYTRKWDLSNSPSVCVHCSIGCNTIVGERYGSVRRILSRYNHDVNGYFICDRGRFGYEFINSPDRVRRVMASASDNATLEEIPYEERIPLLTSFLKGKRIAGIGSPAASLESNFALEALVGKENFYHGTGNDQYELVKTAAGILKNTPAHCPSLREISMSDAVLILGEDLTESAPMLALAVRQAARNLSFRMAEKSGIPAWNDAAVREMAQDKRSPVFVTALSETKLDDIAKVIYHASPDDIAGLGFVIASLVDANAPGIKDSAGILKDMAEEIAGTLMTADNPLIITGLQSNNQSLLHAAANIAIALSNKGKNPSLSVVFPECNSLGLALMDGNPLEKLGEALLKRETDTIIILENDLYKRAGKELADSILARAGNLIILDSHINDTSRRAGILLPAGTFAEATGTIVSNEGRAQRYYRVLPQDGQVSDSWKFIAEMIKISGTGQAHPWEKFDDLVAAFVNAYPLFSEIEKDIPDAGFRFFNDKIARQTLRFSGRTSMNAGKSVHEPKPPQENDSPFAFSMEGYKGVTPSGLTPYYWSAGWNSVQAMNKYMEEPDGEPVFSSKGVLLFRTRTDLKTDYYETEL